MLAHQLDRLSERNRWSRDFTLNSLRRALREIIACFEVYRSYITGRDISLRDRRYVDRAVAQARRRNPAISASIFEFVRDMLLLQFQEDTATEAVWADQVRLVGKFQQLTAPVMAKGFEDTTFYVYNRLVSLNEVGGDPGQFGAPLGTFHDRNRSRRERHPHALSASATHDTKRGEDTRARINVLSEVPDEWRRAAARWHLLNKRHRGTAEGETMPDRNDEYFLYQTLAGAWPLRPYTPEQFADFVGRVQAYMQKAVHEAKVHTSWVNPSPAYDDAVRHFVARVLDREKNARFIEDFEMFQDLVTHYGLFNSLSQTLVKLASPGAPDVFQGTELWDFSLVDPDNRRPVDYGLRQRLLAELDARAADPAALPALARELTESRADGRAKLYVVSRALRCRRDHPGLLTSGEYLPAQASEPYDVNVCAFVRRTDGAAALAAAPRLLRRQIRPGQLPLGAAVWGDGVLWLPEGGRRWRNVFTGEMLPTAERGGRPCLPLAAVFGHFPVALFLPEEA
jgi:(1->4)-alpha-D-glucan 1-alpha-D-glucosylmutase